MRHRDLARIADDAFAAARQRAGSWIACSSGCDSCCRRPFAITQADAVSLREGFAQLPEWQQAAVLARALESRKQLSFDFPGDTASAILTDREDWRDWFFAKHAGVACPVLDSNTGACLLYAYRPIACRLYGPLIQIGGQVSDPCPLCFVGASEQEISGTRVVVPLPSAPTTAPGDTLIAFALSSPK